MLEGKNNGRTFSVDGPIIGQAGVLCRPRKRFILTATVSFAEAG